MQPHIKNYHLSTGIAFGDFVACEVCGAVAKDIHHVVPRSKFGKKRKHEQDAPTNLIALCRNCHDKAHASKEFNESLKDIIKQRNGN